MVCERNYYGEIKACTIHDVMRGLCMRKAREKLCLDVMDNIGLGYRKCTRARNLREWYHLDDSTIRSVLYFGHGNLIPISSGLHLLRVLDGCNARLCFPSQIEKLVNLRYLAFLFAEKDEFTSSLSKLCKLQTLIVVRDKDKWRYKGRTLYLPSDMLKNMPWLRHLLVDRSSFSPYPCGTPNGNLQVLSGVIDLRFTEEAIEQFPDLKTLGIVYRYNEGTEWSFYCMENVVHLHQLENLKFDFIGGDGWCLPLNISFPQKLNKVTLSGCVISWKHSSVIGSLPNLEVLKFKNVTFENHEWKTNEGEFSKLKFLHVGSVGLESWEVEEAHFPSLECLSLRYCVSLKCIPCGIGEIQSLQNIILDECSLDVVDSANEILNEQREFGNESLQLHVYPDKNGRDRSGICFHKNYAPSYYW